MVIAEGNLSQQSILLKEALSHTPDPVLDAAQIIPVDHMEVPDADGLAEFVKLARGDSQREP